LNKNSVQELKRLLHIKPIHNGELILSSGEAYSKTKPCEVIVCRGPSNLLHVYLKDSKNGVALSGDDYFFESIQLQIQDAGIPLTGQLYRAESGIQTDSLVSIELNVNQNTIVNNHVRKIKLQQRFK
jgi:hypothetical protein